MCGRRPSMASLSWASFLLGKAFVIFRQPPMPGDGFTGLKNVLLLIGDSHFPSCYSSVVIWGGYSSSVALASLVRLLDVLEAMCVLRWVISVGGLREFRPRDLSSQVLSDFGRRLGGSFGCGCS